MKRKKALIRSIIVVLVAILAILIYYYFILMRPLKYISKEAPRETNLIHIKTINGPTPTDSFEKPHSIALDKDNNIYVADSKKSRIVVFDKNGNFKFKFGIPATLKEIKARKVTKGKLILPTSIAVDNESGNIYVADVHRHAILVFDSKGKFNREWLVMSPLRLGILGEKIYATTYGPLYIFDKKDTSEFGKVLKKIGKHGRRPNEFSWVNGINFSNDGKIFYIADSQNHRIFAFSQDGNVVWVSGKPSKSMNDRTILYEVPNGITLDDNGLIYTMELMTSNIAVVSPNGKKITTFGEQGTDDNQFFYATDIKYMGDRRFVIADKNLNRIQIIDVPITEKMSKAIEKETGKKVAPTTGKSIFQRIIDFFKTLLGL